MQQSRTASLGLLVLRIVVGVIFAIHGAQKLFTGMLPDFAAYLTRMGIPLPDVAAVLVAFVEFGGGILLIFGLFTRVAATLIAIDMIVAILKVHLRRGFFNPSGFEYPLTLFAVNFAFVYLGAGAWSLDRWLHTPSPADQPFDSRPLAQGKRPTTPTNN